MKKEVNKKDIAIIGLSCRFMDSNSPMDFWNHLCKGNELIRFYSDEELIKLGVEQSVINDKNFVRVNSFIPSTEYFDYNFFGYTKDEANLMDPQIRIMHELIWSAMEDAGYMLSSHKEKIGLYLAASDNLNWMAHGMTVASNNVDPFQLSNIINKNYISSLISYNLNFKGPSYVIDTACSSSLTAVHIACRNLLLRDCSLAIAGGICLDTASSVGYFFEEGMIASRDGHCRAFDEKASGSTKGEGGGVVVLKRLNDALNDKDYIYAVIRSSASNNDGKHKVGYTAPSVTGQSECIKLAHSIANVPPSSISFVEAHGTATKLGDPIELDALNKAFNHDNSFKCAIGSVKTNIGHLDYAAGIAGLLKASLAINHRMIPPSLHYTSANPEIDFSAGPFYVNKELKKWGEEDNPGLLRAGVSSFGIGGTNVHVILEGLPDERTESKSRPYQLITYSSKSKNATFNYAKKLLDFAGQGEFDLCNSAYTLNTCRENFQHRSFVVALDDMNFKHQLESLNKKEHGVTESKLNRKVVFMFSGQGSQYYQMARDLYEHEPHFRSTMDKGFKLLHELTGKDFKEILGYSIEGESDVVSLNQTEFTQPVLFLLEYALAKLLIYLGIKPDYLIGHSLGEYVAACISEVYPLEVGLQLIVKRGKRMGELAEGDMISIGALEAEISDILPAGVSVAAVNTGQTCVISGPKEEIKELIGVLDSKNISYTKLRTSHAFHSSMMDEMLEDFEKELSKIHFSAPKYPMLSNLTGRLMDASEIRSSKYWVRQLRETVRFNDGLNIIYGEGDAFFIEIGPGNTLALFARQNKNHSPKSIVLNLLRRPAETSNDQQKFLFALGQMWSAGLSINWQNFYKHESRKKIPVPTYNFDKYKLNFKVDPFSHLNIQRMKSASTPLADWFYVPKWKKETLRKTKRSDQSEQNYLVFSQEAPLISAIGAKLSEEGSNLLLIRKGTEFVQTERRSFIINPNNEQDFEKLFFKLESDGIVINQIIFNWKFEGGTQQDVMSVFLILKRLYTCLIGHFPDVDKKITLLGDFGHPIINQEKVNIPVVTSMALLNVCSQETPNLYSSTIDVVQNECNMELTAKIVDEIKFNFSDRTVAYRNEERWIKFYDQLNLYSSENTYIEKNKVYLVTGGLGEVGGVLGRHLVDKYNSKIILLGRSNIPDEEKWPAIFKENSNPVLIERIKKLQRIAAESKNVFYYSCDISDINDLSEKILLIEKEHGNISGIIHAAGNIDDKTFKVVENITESIAQMQFSPKIDGTLNIYNIFKDRELDFVWITSSLASVLGGLTYAAYAVANSFIDTFIISKQRELKKWFCVNLDGVSEARISHEKLVQVFEKSFSVDELPQVIISVNDPNKFVQQQSRPKETDEENEDVTVDRQSLRTEYAPPLTQIECQLCDVWESFFGYAQIGTDDSFFELGGDSLKAMTILKRIHKTFKVEIGVEEFFLAPTIKDMATKIDAISRIHSIQSHKGSKVIRI